jgi:hypothetical protein
MTAGLRLANKLFVISVKRHLNRAGAILFTLHAGHEKPLPRRSLPVILAPGGRTTNIGLSIVHFVNICILLKVYIDQKHRKFQYFFHE